MTRQDVIELVEQLPEQQLPIVADFIHSIMLPLEAEHGSNNAEEALSQEQNELLDLLNYTVETGITDLARNHNHYLYKTPLSSKMESNLEDEQGLDEEQQRLLNLLNHTISSGRGDFAENLDLYLYSNKGQTT